MFMKNYCSQLTKLTDILGQVLGRGRRLELWQRQVDGALRAVSSRSSFLPSSIGPLGWRRSQQTKHCEHLADPNTAQENSIGTMNFIAAYFLITYSGNPPSLQAVYLP